MNITNLRYFLENELSYLKKNDFSPSCFFEICEEISQLEPWDEIDALIFDETFTWTIAITHEEFLIRISE